MKQLENYYKAVEDLTKLFCKRYFKNFYNYRASDWVGGDIGGVICINDYWFNVKNIETAIKYKATKKELFGYYDYSLENDSENKDCVSFERYLKYFRGFSFKEIEKQLEKGQYIC